MSTRPTQATIRAFNYAIECIAEPEGQAAFRSDFNRMLAQGVPEFDVVEACHSCALTMAMVRAMEAAEKANDIPEALALAIVPQIRTASKG